jgi:hypothetical protein
MKTQKFYAVSKKRHGHLNRDVVHDLVVKFGQDLPSDAYVVKCISHARPQPIQQKFDPYLLLDEWDGQEQEDEIENSLQKVYTALNSLRDRYELEVDTFLECRVNGNLSSFSQRSGISKSVLEKICKFVQYEVLRIVNIAPEH